MVKWYHKGTPKRGGFERMTKLNKERIEELSNYLEIDFRDLKNSINGLIGEATDKNYQLLTAEQITSMIENHIIENLKELIEELKK